MSNIWKKQRDVGQHPKRNNFDLSFQSHCTFKFGYIYPVFKRLVYPGDSFRIDSAFDLKMMPVEFPVQSRIRAYMYYFYVRNKNIWNGWEDFISGRKSVNDNPPPYVLPTADKIKNGSIYDFLNNPTSVVGASDRTVLLNVQTGFSGSDVYAFGFGGDSFNTSLTFPQSYRNYPSTGFTRPCLFSMYVFTRSSVLADSLSVSQNLNTEMKNILGTSDVNLSAVFYKVNKIDEEPYWDYENAGVLDFWVTVNYKPATGVLAFSNSAVSTFNDKVSLLSDDEGYFVVFTARSGTYDYSALSRVYSVGDFSGASFKFASSSPYYEYSDLNLHLYDRLLPLSALPFRAYESIYRSYFASDVWQPLVVDGEKEYNRFNTTIEGGQDSTDYHLFRRNYELDFLTSALPSPQAGPAPLVGINALGQITVTDENGITTADAVVDDDGKITQVAITSPLASVEHGRTIMNIVNAGMSINDFRNVNALQNFLEQTLRSGYRYMNFVKGHFGVEPKYSELDMPEFIGGYSRDVQMSTVVSQANTLGNNAGSSLGDFAGLGRVVGGSNHSISHFCDDYGWIMGVMCIVPTPAYSQLLPKENLVPTNYLDFYSPEFAQIGMQPITYKEVCPIQSYLDGLVDPSKRLEDTFGYQRPNYDCVAAVDEVHGEFRGTLSQQLINRIFDGRPELSSSFLEIDPAEVNDIFINRNPDDDVFIGHLAFRVQSKRPFPRVHFPSLGH